MLIFRHLMTVSVGVVLALIYGSSTTAQGLPSLSESQSNQSSSNVLPNASADSLSPAPETSQKGDRAPQDTPIPALPASIPLEVSHPPEDNFNELLKAEPRVVDIKQFGNKQFPSQNQPDTSQPVVPPPAESPQETTTPEENQPAPEDLNPSGNPLLFPTAPGEVETTRVEPVTLNQAIELALQNNKDLQEARVTLERRRAELNEALSAQWPTLSTQVVFNRQDAAEARLGAARSEQRFQQEFQQQEQQLTEQVEQGQITQQQLEQALAEFEENNRPDSQTTSTNVTGSVELSYNVYTGGRRSADIDRAEREVRRSELDVERISEQTRFDATDNYYLLQNADAQVAIEQASVEDSTQSLRDARLLEQAGLGTRFDVLRAEVELATASQRLTRAIAEQRRARRQLAETLSLGQKAELTAADEIKPAGNWQYSLDDSIVLAYKNRAELEQELLQREIAENQREIALADIKPQVSLFARYEYVDNFDDTVGVASGYVLGTRLQWTIWDGGRAVARAEESNRDIDLANTRFANQRNQIRFQVESAYFDLIANQENIQTTRLNVQRAEEALRLARLRFQAGVGTQTDVIDSQRDLTNARSSFLQAIIQYNQALNRLQRSVSNLPDNRLFEER